MQIYLAGTYSRDYVVQVYLAENDGYRKIRFDIPGLYILESYYYAKDNAWIMEYIPRFKGFLLDSGAFTFMSGNATDTDFVSYTKQYAAFINEHNIDKFFELDIDSVVPWQTYLDLRKMLEDLTGKDPIPVFHKSRGKEWFQDAVRSHNYIAIGGIVSGEIKRSEIPFLKWFIDEAHANDCKIHGLGFTNLSWLKKLQWDSVDSTTWLHGNRSGVIYGFNGQTIIKHRGPKGSRLKPKDAAIHNFQEWVKFSQYMERAYARS